MAKITIDVKITNAFVIGLCNSTMVAVPTASIFHGLDSDFYKERQRGLRHKQSEITLKGDTSNEIAIATIFYGIRASHIVCP